MYTDIAGFSRMMEKDEAGTLKLLNYHNDLISGIAESHHGKVIKTIGDALLIDFKNTVEALQSAMEVQDRLYEHNKENPGLPLLVRIGVHLGDIYFYENDALGEGINIAARLQSLARPGCICFSQDVYNLVLNKIEFHAQKLGKVSLKNITKEIHAYEITTPNVGFDPNKDKPRPGYTPGSYKDGEEDDSEEKATEASPQSKGGAELLTRIRREILEETKALGRRMTVAEAKDKYGHYGVEAEEVIATMADQSLLAKGTDRPSAGSSSLPPFLAGFGRNEKGEFDTDALKGNIEAAVNGIVNEIERSVEKNMTESERERYEEKYRHHMERAQEHVERAREHAERHREHDRERHEGQNESNDPEAMAGDFEAYRRRLERHSHSGQGGLVGNLTSYLAVNGLLWFINLSTSTHFLWAAFVSAGWGIGVAATIVSSRRASEKLREIDAMPELDSSQLADLKRLNKMKDAMAQHTSSTVMVCLLFAVINLLTSPAFLWFLIPSAAMVVGFLAHFASYSASKPRLERKILDALGIKGGWRNIFKQGKARRQEAVGLGPYADLYREAQAAKEAIAAQLASGSAGAASVDTDLAPSLDQYLGQVKLLAQSANEIDRLVESIPMTDLSKDKASLAAKEAAASPSLKAEYRHSIEEIDKQEKSYAELKEQSEVVKLRLSSSVNQLKQMRLDIARLSASPNAEGGADLSGLKRRTDELSRYLEDLRSGYAESKDDPFAQLEAEEKKRLEAEAGKDNR